MPDTRGAAYVVHDRRGLAGRRDPKAAVTPLSWQSRGLPMVPEWDAQQAVRSAYLSNTIVYRCVRVTADALSRVPIRVGANPEKPKDYDTRGQTGLGRLLNPAQLGGKANPVTTARRLLAWTVAQHLVCGRFGWETELADDDRALPVGLWPLPATQLHPVPSTAGSRYFDSYTFGHGQQRKTLKPNQVVYAWRPSQQDWREPETVLQAARLDVSVAVMQDRYDYAFLRNGSRPDFLIVTPTFAEDSEFEAFKQQWSAEHRGPDNAGKPAFLEADPDEHGGAGGAVDVKQIGMSQRDSQSIERYRQKIAAICVAFGTPMSKLGDASGRTFSNAGQEDTNWWEDTLLPLGEELLEEVNLQLASRFPGGNVAWFDWSTVRALQPEPKFQQVGVPALVGKVATLNEGRAMLDLPSITGGDTLDVEGVGPDLQAAAAAFSTLVASGVTPESAAAVVGLPSLVMADVAPPPPTPVLIPAQASGADRGATGEHREAEGETVDGDTRREARWKAVNDRAEQLEQTWARAFRSLFAKQEKATLNRLTGKRGRQLLTAVRASDDAAPEFDPADVYDPTFWAAETEERALELVEVVTSIGGQDVAQRFDIAWDISDPRVQEFIEARANQLAGQVTDTTYDAIKKALADGVAAGDSIDDLATRVRHVFTVASEARAVTIARTEVISAYNGAALLAAAELPEDVVAGKEWVATRDARTREAHSNADGQVRRVADAFDVDGEAMQYPGAGSAANVVNCRCTVGFLTPDEMDDAGRARQVDVRTARFALDLVARGELTPEDLRSRLQVVA